MSMTKAQAQERLDASLAALAAAERAVSYSVGDLSVSRAPLTELRGQVSYWRRIVASYEAREGGASGFGAYARFR